MSSSSLSAALQAHVLADAGHRCGYCHADERLTGMALSTEHLLPHAAGGLSVRENLWRTCRACNGQKGAQVHATDPGRARRSRSITRVYSRGTRISGGAATVRTSWAAPP